MYKLIIIDDKPNVTEGLRRFGDWADRRIEVAGSASNGLEALQLLEAVRPHIAVTDIAMPLMNGLEFAAEAYKTLPGLKIIVLSGYDQFGYAQQALRLGVMDYLLKPVKIDQIIAAVERARDALDAENTTARELQILRRQNQKSDWSLELDSMLEQPERWQTLCHSDLPAAMIRLGLPEWRPDLRLVLLVPPGLSARFEGEWPDRFLVVKERYSLTLASEAEVNMTFARNGEEINSPNRYILLSTPLAGPGELPQQYGALLKRLELVEFNSAALALAGPVLLTEKLVQPEHVYPVEVEHEIVQGLQLGLTEAIPALVNRFYFTAASGGLLDPVEARAIGMRLLTRCAQALGWQGDEKHWGPIYAENRTRAELETGLSGLLGEQARLVAEQRREKNKSSVERAIEFIRLNLYREISLDDVANEVHFTPSYLANQFKKATGETVVEYIGRLKMERAAELVCDPNIKIASIAQVLGYNDRRYFSELFRRKFGCTPSEYRDRFWFTQTQGQV